MNKLDVYYYEEKKYAGNRLSILFLVSALALFFASQTTGVLHSQMRLIQLVLGGLFIISLLHFLIIAQRPYLLVGVRKAGVIVLDLSVLALLVGILGHAGLFFLPLFVIIVMQSGMSFGMPYFYLSLIVSVLVWVALVTYTDYWHTHSDIIAVFALTTFLVPLFYLTDIIRIHAQNDALNEELSSSEHNASYDALTGVANRKTYEMKMTEVMAVKRPFALIFIDLNKFKIINDTHGHGVGDEVLIEVSRRLNSAIAEEDFLSRLGGDEFVVITHRDKSYLPRFLKQLEQDVIGKHHIDGLNVFIKLSMGVSIYPDDTANVSKLCEYADEAMYAAKKRSDTYHVFYRDL